MTDVEEVRGWCNGFDVMLETQLVIMDLRLMSDLRLRLEFLMVEWWSDLATRARGVWVWGLNRQCNDILSNALTCQSGSRLEKGKRS